ncbi:MAG: IS1634 family transposase [Proteobacteria bacterium]|nr:IS1634 family transposase [Pseudomonadota bacterium]
MYLRTTQRRNKDGSTVTYFQLAHNSRDPYTNNSVPKIIHNFGRADQLDRDALKRLCVSIARVCNVEIIDTEKDLITSDWDGTNVDLPQDVTLVRTVELGPISVIESLWEECGIGAVLRAAAKKKRCKIPYERALLAMTANRLCEPESKLGVWERWNEKVFFPCASELKLDHMYEAMDLLHASSARVEEEVFFKTADLMNLDVDVVFYDTTTTSFSIDYEDADDEENEGLRKLGHSKEGTWTPQVVVALAVTREGVPVRSWVFPGNTSDVTTVEKIKADLKGWKLGRFLFVADSGMSSDDNRLALGKACGKYLLATRVGSVKEIKEEVISRRGRYKVINKNLHAREVVVGGDGARRRRYILCYNPQEAERQGRHRAEVVRELKAHLARHKDRIATSQWAIELLASKRYKRYLKVTESKQIQIDQERIHASGKQDGKWVLITNDDTLTVEDAAQGYKGLLVIERCFRSLKRTQIKMGPMYHWLPHRIEAHVKICVLALLLERVAELRCGRPWLRIRNVLARLQATEFRTSSAVFFRRNEPTSELRRLLKSLGVSMPKSVVGVTQNG